MKHQRFIQPCDQEHSGDPGWIVVSKWGDNVYRYPSLKADTIDCCYSKETAEQVWAELEPKVGLKACGQHLNQDRWIVVADLGEKVYVFPPRSADRPACCIPKETAEEVQTKIKQQYHVNG